jgi:hypothetical protein
MFLGKLVFAAALLPASPPAVSSQQVAWEFGLLVCSLAQERRANQGEPGQGREMLCRFRPGDRGAEESYAGTLQFIGRHEALSGTRTIIFVVKGPIPANAAPGLLQQTYGPDASSSADQQAPLVGRRNSSIMLQLEAEKSDQPSMALGQPNRTMIVGVELTLRSTPA